VVISRRRLTVSVIDTNQLPRKVESSLGKKRRSARSSSRLVDRLQEKQAMSTDGNKAVIRKLFAAMDAHDLDLIEKELINPGYHLRFDSMPEMDKAGAVPFFRAFVTSFPDISHTLEELIAEGDHVGCRLTVRGTNTAGFMGMPATNQAIEISSINMFRLKDSQIVDQQVNSDGVGMMRQLGLIPDSGQPQERM
jgi:predicted SnoaL-like aldol condensation-catalyzing enzyme